MREGEREIERERKRTKEQERKGEHKIEEATLERVEHELGRLHASRREHTYELRSTYTLKIGIDLPPDVIFAIVISRRHQINMSANGQRTERTGLFKHDLMC